MRASKGWIAIGAIGVVALIAWAARGAGSPSEEPVDDAEEREEDVAPAIEVTVAPAAMPEHVRWIAVGGGADPELNQISLEEDLLLAREVLGDGGVVLFAGGPGTRAVQVTDDAERGDPLRRELGDLLVPRGGRDARYQPARLAMHGPATLDATVEALRAALVDGDEPLLLWVAAHGDRGELPADSTALLWGGTELAPTTIAETIASTESPRPLRMVITSCYAGGFAELAFDGLDPDRGPSSLDVCGLFATSWDEEAGGCDPSPDRASHEAWSIHVLEALRGRDRAGNDVHAEIDLDHDGRVSLAEADARARIAALSFDLPTSTSARLLRVIAPSEGPSAAVSMPEDEAVVRAIGERLDIEGEGDAQARLDALARRRVELEAAIEARAEEADEAWWAVVGELLSRWPVLDDPWHPDFDATLVREADAIRAFLGRSEARARWLEAQDDLGAMQETEAALRVQAAPLRRWLEAYESIALAGRLRARGGEAWDRYERMRACERGTW
ncbi:hypothetical protein [Sandaracinus amylolyticus]|uniref:Uncharacterized protein n=1 Tax=Sandaracinus amylolyticus TaxID=927083 RepID=A0A0F6YLM6_9BACT|nr:hypothetical protein [Sandaracinus amylolyticus]AKF08503.1 hypothetical protein DB32_005652 [Sandaracinus amylolyticus]